MLLKRVYDTSGDKPVLSHVKVLRKGDVQKFSTRFIEQQLQSGIVSFSDGRLTLKTHKDDEPVVYRVVSAPGYYCCHCNVSLGGEKECKTHVTEKHNDTDSPDCNNPSGYRRDNCYTCVLDDSDLTADQAEKIVQKQRQQVLDSIGDKHLQAVQRSLTKQKKHDSEHKVKKHKKSDS